MYGAARIAAMTQRAVVMAEVVSRVEPRAR